VITEGHLEVVVLMDPDTILRLAGSRVG
jgi:hypothetical protein